MPVEISHRERLIIEALVDWSMHTQTCDDCRGFDNCDDREPCDEGKILFANFIRVTRACARVRRIKSCETSGAVEPGLHLTVVPQY
jgi:hypothetical protein